MAATARIAVVNHDSVFLRLIDRVLRGDGHEPILCPSGTAAHEVIVQQQPDLIMIDTWLEVQEAGWALVQTLRLDEATRRIPILICSSDPNEVKRRAGQLETMPNVDVLPKPFDPESLLAKVAQMMDGRFER
jgi:CheY-like chemotaxis protein